MSTAKDSIRQALENGLIGYPEIGSRDESYSEKATRNYIDNVIKYRKKLGGVDMNNNDITLIFAHSKNIIDNMLYIDLLDSYLEKEKAILRWENGRILGHKLPTLNGKINKIKQNDVIRHDIIIESRDIRSKSKSSKSAKIGGINLLFFTSGSRAFDDTKIYVIIKNEKEATDAMKQIHINVDALEFKKEVTNIETDDSKLVLYYKWCYLHEMHDKMKYNLFINIDDNEELLNVLIYTSLVLVKLYSDLNKKKIKNLTLRILPLGTKKNVAHNIIKGIIKGILRIPNLEETIKEIEFDGDQYYKEYSKLKTLDKPVSSIEIYEFQLHDYPEIINKKGVNANKSTKFNKIENINQGECGKIGIDAWKWSDTEPNENILTSCDLISSSGGGYDYDELYNVYLNYDAKTIPDYQYSNNVIKDIYDVMFNAQQLGSDIMDKFCKNRGKTSKIEHMGAYVMYKVVTENVKIILFGDFHGSFHTFFRHMLRLATLDILDLKSYKISDNYMIIFLGDIIDRGQFAIEIVQFVCKLIVANNDILNDKINVLYIRGNHETSEQYEYEEKDVTKDNIMLIDEIYRKFGKDSEDSKNILGVLYNLFAFSLSAVIINNDNNKYWLSHGGIPINTAKLGNLPSVDHEIIFYEYDNDVQIKKGAVGTKTLDDLIKYNNEQDFFSIPWQIRWNDFGIKPLHPNRGYAISDVKLYEFMDKHGINFVIRGHQDIPLNSYLFSNNENIQNGADIDFDSAYRYDIKEDRSNEGIKYINYNTLDKFDCCHSFGPIARLTVGEKWLTNGKFGLRTKYEEIYPVLTLSTNTDIDRDMSRDSFAILRFDLQEILHDDFADNINLLDSRNVTKTLPTYPSVVINPVENPAINLEKEKIDVEVKPKKKQENIIEEHEEDF